MKYGMVVLAVLLLFVGCDQLSSVGSPKVEDKTPPAEVTNLVAVPGDGRIALSWTPPADADFHHVVVTGAGQTLTVAKGTATAVLSGLANGTSYSVQIKTVDAAGNASAGVSVTALPVAPTTPNGGQISLTSPSGNFWYGMTNGYTNGAPYYLPIPLEYTASGASTVQYRLNNGPWTAATPGKDLANEVKTKFGFQTLEVQGLDGSGAVVATKSVEFLYFNPSKGDDGGITGQINASWANGGGLTTPATNQSQGTVGFWSSQSAGGVPTVSGGNVSLANQTDVSGSAGTALWTNFAGRTALPSLGMVFLPVRDLPYNSSGTANTQNYITAAFAGYTSPRYSQLGAMLSPQPNGQYTLLLFHVVTDTSNNPPTTTFVQLGGASNQASFSAPDWTPSTASWPTRYNLALLKDGSTYWAMVVDSGSISVDANNKPTNHVGIVAKVKYSGTIGVLEADLLGVGVGFRNLGSVPTRFPQILAMWR